MIILEKDEIKKLTGSSQRKGQIRNLEDNDFTFSIGIDGWPRVMVSNVHFPNQGIKSEKEPNFNWMKDNGKKKKKR
tara:strand:+ start:120 stop:347 length:228 start_codon:yes stop_codon:yes gene_type:complete